MWYSQLLLTKESDDIMNKKISLGLALSLIAIAIAVTFILTSFFSLQSFNKKVVDVNEKSRKYSSLQALDTYVRESYLGDINENELKDGILKGYVSGLDDKNSVYLTPEEYINEKNSTSGQQVGLGLTLAPDESGYIRITNIMNNSPVLELGLQENDIITAVNDLAVSEVGFNEAVTAMSGTEGTKVTLTVRRDGIDKKYTFTRRTIEENTVYSEMEASYIGYIRIGAFKDNTPQQFINALERLTTNGATSIILDLRDNAGGPLAAVEECLDPLLPEGVAATAEFRDGHSETAVYSNDSDLDIPIATIVNSQTASTAELFASVLHDVDGAVMVGEQTKGYGTMQVISEFENGSAVKLSVAEYQTAAGTKFNKVGLTPDIQVENEDDNLDAQYLKAAEVLKSIDK